MYVITFHLRKSRNRKIKAPGQDQTAVSGSLTECNLVTPNQIPFSMCSRKILTYSAGLCAALRLRGPGWQRNVGLKKINGILKPEKNYQSGYNLQETNVNWASHVCFDYVELIKYYFLSQILIYWSSIDVVLLVN